MCEILDDLSKLDYNRRDEEMKVICVKVPDGIFNTKEYIVGKIYDVVDFKILNEYNTDLGHVNSVLGTNCFKEYKEECQMAINKSELEDYDRLTLKNGCVIILIGKAFFGKYGDCNILDLTNYNKDLTYKGNNSDYDIAKVERPTYFTMFKRKEKFKITMKQIAEKFGQDVDDILIERGDD